MNLDRRSFIRASLIAGGGIALNPFSLKASQAAFNEQLFSLNPFLLENPNAVFIMKTDVDIKTNSEAMKEAGFQFANSVFGYSNDSETGIPLTHKYVFRPNLTCRQSSSSKYTVEGSMGIVTDSNFMEGIINSMQELGIPGSGMHIREVNCAKDLADGGYIAMAERTGIDLAGIETPYYGLDPSQIQWKDVPNGVYFKKLPYLWPYNTPDSWLMNVSKLKAHGMGITLSAKNIQGALAMNYQAHCSRHGTHLEIKAADRYDDAFTKIMNNYNRHVADGIPRWNKPGGNGGIWMETWASRCIDNNLTLKAGLHVIEGIYGRDGDFLDGPGEGGLAQDYMCNYIIFGLNPFYVDIIGHWIAGHEPGNFGLFHIAKERGLITHFNPSDIPLYDWNPDNGATLASLSSYERTPLKTYYLRKDYDGGKEPKWHMVDEEYQYASTVGIQNNMQSLPFELGKNYPNPVKWKTTIPFNIQKPGNTYIEIINPHGVVVDILQDGYLAAGSHMVSWQSMHYAPGVYFCRMRFEGMVQIGSIMVVH